MWRVFYPCGIHFLVSQLVAYAAVYVLTLLGDGIDAFQQHAVFLTGLSGLLSMAPCLYFYKKDQNARLAGGLLSRTSRKKLGPGEAVLVFFMGIAFSQFVNLLVALFQNVLNYQQYQESMEQITYGKDLLTLVFWMGVIAPLAEEVIFRWLIYLRLRDYMRMGAAVVISGVFFGIYHMNLVQAVYAGILGMLFAYFMEITGSLWTSVLLHMGTNIWSLVFSAVAPWILEKDPVWILYLYVFLLFIMTAGILYFQKRAGKANAA